jgi:hypothetical protein
LPTTGHASDYVRLFDCAKRTEICIKLTLFQALG